MAADLYWDSTSHHEIYQLFIHILSSQQPSATWVTYALHSAQSTCWVDWNCSTKTRLAGATAVAHWNWQCLGSTETQVQSPAPHSRLRIRRCHSCSLVCSCSLDLIPGPRVPCAWVKQTKKKRLDSQNHLLLCGNNNLQIPNYGHVRYLIWAM